MSNWEFPGSSPIDVVIELAAGNIAISGETTDVTTVSLEPSRQGRHAEDLIDSMRVSFTNGRLEIIQPNSSGVLRIRSGVDLTVKVPVGSRCRVSAAAADVACVGELSTLTTKTASGDVTAASITGDAEIVATSGDIWLENAGGNVRAESASGDIRVKDVAGDATATTASGDVTIGRAGGSVNARTASGDVEIASIGAGRAEVKTVSGDVSVGVLPGTGVYLDLSTLTGRVSNLLDEAGEEPRAGLRLTARAVSGDIRVSRATVGAGR
ncbi:MAG TPA: DUF4097 family beta strand repeat-containing protein [Streptosporangiaceae bacterium]|jgi:DUF4097 and DUF4098 domain-containing protein YvlB